MESCLSEEHLDHLRRKNTETVKTLKQMCRGLEKRVSGLELETRRLLLSFYSLTLVCSSGRLTCDVQQQALGALVVDGVTCHAAVPARVVSVDASCGDNAAVAL